MSYLSMFIDCSILTVMFNCCVMFTGLRKMGYLYNCLEQFEESESCLTKALDILQSGYLTQTAEAGFDKKTWY